MKYKAKYERGRRGEHAFDKLSNISKIFLLLHAAKFYDL